MRVWGLVLTAALVSLAGTGRLSAQTTEAAEPAVIQSAVLILDKDTLFSGTKYGQRILAEIQLARETLQSENTTIADGLTAEETALAEGRPTMEPAAFRAAADAFDAKVLQIRREQADKEAAIQTQLATAQAEFDAAVRPILAQIMSSRGGAVLMGRRDVILYLGAVDITLDAIAQVDLQLGDGTASGQ